MDIIKSILGDNMGELVSTLTSQTGFSTDEARRFVPEATGSVVDAVKGAGDVDFSNMGQAAQTVMEKVDTAALAGKVGMDTEKVQNGLGALVPQLLTLLQEKAGGIAGLQSMLGGLGQGGLGGIAGGLGKMFGK